VGGHARAGRVEEYAQALRDELADRTSSGDRLFKTIYVGGGTPTVLPADLLVRLVSDLASGLEEGGELTVEANPGTIDASLLTRLAESGATRLSLGVQSFVRSLRAALGRQVSDREIEAALAAIAMVGWREWNLDLVFGIPGQSWRDATADVDRAVQEGPTHISLYDLTYTPGYAKRVDDTLGFVARPAAGEMAEEHYAEAVARLEGAGYLRYEISNFALPGHECRHNQAYWRGHDYLGIGAAAVSTSGEERRTNPRSVLDYLAGRSPEVERLSAMTRVLEKAMLGLRTRQGVDEESVLAAVDCEVRDRLLAQGYLERRYGKLRVNPGLLDVSNSVIGALLVSPGES
jgi:oxygen-independent coproporphyrinogen-3 oxidase